jgi:hypothetical protein
MIAMSSRSIGAMGIKGDGRRPGGSACAFRSPEVQADGGEDEVVMQSEEGRGHSNGWLASRRDAWIFRTFTGGVASLNHRLMAAMPPASFGGAGSWPGGVASLNSFDWNERQ